MLRGFYLRLDEAQANAERVQRRLQGFTPRRPVPELTPDGGPLAAWDLDQRLYLLESEQGLAPPQAALLALAVHEAGHLPETIPWTRLGVPVFGLLPKFLGSMFDYGDPVLWLEYRAQARALASGRATRWLLAELVYRSLEPRDPYHGPYRRLLEDLLEHGTAEGLPHLSQWNAVEPQRIAELAADLCHDQGIELLPEAGLAALDALIGELDSR